MFGTQIIYRNPLKIIKNKINNALNLVKKSICLPSGLNLKETDISKICKFINNFK